jgi:hypothetical protein
VAAVEDVLPQGPGGRAREGVGPARLVHQQGNEAGTVDNGELLLFEGTDGIRSRLLADELTTYVRDPNGKTRPEKNKFADLLMAWLIGQYIAYQVKPPTQRKPGQQMRSMLSDAAQRRWQVR